MGSVTYAFRGQKIEDEQGNFLAQAGRDLSGKSVRWDAGDFLPVKGTIDFKDKHQAKRLTDALWRLHEQSGFYDVESDWVV